MLKARLENEYKKQLKQALETERQKWLEQAQLEVREKKRKAVQDKNESGST